MAATLRDAREWGIDPFEVTAIGVGDPMAKAAADYVNPRAATKPVVAPNMPVIPFDGYKLGKTAIDGAFIYPPWGPAHAENK
jgi:hypothetical protein